MSGGKGCCLYLHDSGKDFNSILFTINWDLQAIQIRRQPVKRDGVVQDGENALVDGLKFRHPDF
jgi:hypothetical protein